MLGKSLGRGLGKWAAAADRGDPAVGLDDIALAAQQKCLLFVGNQQQSFQVTQELVGTPVFGQLHGGAADVAVILLQFGLKAAEKRERVRSRAGKSGQNLLLIQAADLLGRVLYNAAAERDLAVS